MYLFFYVDHKIVFCEIKTCQVFLFPNKSLFVTDYGVVILVSTPGLVSLSRCSSEASGWREREGAREGCWRWGNMDVESSPARTCGAPR